MIKKELIFGRPSIEKSEIAEVVKSLKSGWIGTGPKVKIFEDNFKTYKKAKYANAVSSCTAALHLALLSSKIGKGDEVIVPVMTFASTANSVVHTGATPIFVDCEKLTGNIDPKRIEEKISPKTKAIIIVHFAGRPCKMDEIKKIARRNKLILIEDCAHAIESTYKNKPIGTIGDFGCFSFYATKNITTSEGGMILSKSIEKSKNIKSLSMHGQSETAWERSKNKKFIKYEVTAPGYKYNMTDIQASIGIHQLKQVSKKWKKRLKIWKRYNKEFKDLSIVTPPDEPPKNKHALHLYTIMLLPEKNKITQEKFIKEMKKLYIGTGIHYISLHLQPYYKKRFNFKPSDFPNASWISKRTVSLPISPDMTVEEINRVVGAVKKIVKKNESKPSQQKRMGKNS